MTPKQAAWNAFSKYVRAKTPYCLFHIKSQGKIGRAFHCSGPPECCHKISRSKGSLLFDERNVFSGCRTSNGWAHYHQLEWDELWRKMWPEDVEYLDSRKDILIHRKAQDYRDICWYYKQKLKELDSPTTSQERRLRKQTARRKP
jgi:hypothetical protein